MHVTRKPLVISGGVEEKTELEERADEFASFLDAAAGGESLVIAKRTADNGAWAHCKTMQADAVRDDFLDVLQANFGGGTYRVQVRGRTVGGKRQAIAKSYNIVIAPPPVPLTPLPNPVQNIVQPTWDANKIIAVAGAAVPLLQGLRELFTPTNPYQYNMPQTQSGSAGGIADAIMQLQLLGGLKSAMRNVVDDLGGDDDSSRSKRGAMLQALAPLVPMLAGAAAPVDNPAQIVSRETVDDDDDNGVSGMEEIAEAIAGAVKSGDNDTLAAILQELDGHSRAQILGASGLQTAIYAGRYRVPVNTLRDALERMRVIFGGANESQIAG